MHFNVVSGSAFLEAFILLQLRFSIQYILFYIYCMYADKAGHTFILNFLQKAV